MNLEKTVRFHNPKSSRITDDVRSTSDDTLTATDMMTAIGFAQAQCGFGLSAFFGKVGLSRSAKLESVNGLMKVAHARLYKCNALKKLSGRLQSHALFLVCAFSYESYCRSAESKETRCKYCQGRGIVHDLKKAKYENLKVMKPCRRCQGLGYKPIKASDLFKALKALMPEISQPTFSRQIKPVFEELIQVCFTEENRANDALKRVTKKNSS